MSCWLMTVRDDLHAGLHEVRLHLRGEARAVRLFVVDDLDLVVFLQLAGDVVRDVRALLTVIRNGPEEVALRRLARRAAAAARERDTSLRAGDGARPAPTRSKPCPAAPGSRPDR